MKAKKKNSKGTYQKHWKVKSGEIHYGTYGAGKSRKKSLTLVGKGGKINKTYKERINKLIEAAREQDDMALEVDIQRIVTEAKMKGKNLTEKALISKLLEDKTMKMIVNAGYTLEEAAERLNTIVSDLINTNNWDGNIYTDPDSGREYEFKWSHTYTEDVFIEIL